MNEIKIVGIIGSGKMGSDIFNYLSDFNYKLIWYTRNPDHREVLLKTFQKKINRQLKHGIISQDVFDLRSKYKITNNLKEFSQCDLIIESVIEELDVKAELFSDLDAIVKTSCILASNSSSILPSQLIENVKRKNRVLGLHFFYPIAFKNVVELIAPDFTDDISREKAKLFLGDIKRFYLEQNESSAFILNRLLLQIQIVAFNLMIENGLGFKQLDEIAKKLVTDFGLFEMMDHVGHNTMYNAIMNYSRMDSDKKIYVPLLNELKKSKLSDTKASNSFYNLETESRTISKEKEIEIVDKLKEIANKYLTEYSEKYQINLYNLKKGLEEFCGIVL